MGWRHSSNRLDSSRIRSKRKKYRSRRDPNRKRSITSERKCAIHSAQRKYPGQRLMYIGGIMHSVIDMNGDRIYPQEISDMLKLPKSGREPIGLSAHAYYEVPLTASQVAENRAIGAKAQAVHAVRVEEESDVQYQCRYCNHITSRLGNFGDCPKCGVMEALQRI